MKNGSNINGSDFVLTGPYQTMSYEKWFQLTIGDQESGSRQLSIDLIAEVWYYGVITKRFMIDVLLGNINDQLSVVAWIDGPSLISKNQATELAQNNNVFVLYLSFKITTDLMCLELNNNNGSADEDNYNYNYNTTTPHIEYTIRWNVTETSNNINTSGINDYLKHLYNVNQNNGQEQSLMVPSDLIYDMLESGYYYNFHLYFDCIYKFDNNYNINCTSIHEIHEIYYQTPQLICQIAGGNEKIISNIDWTSLMDYNSFYLDGNTFTYDPSLDDITDKSHLSFEWKCSINYGYDANSSDCSSALIDVSSQSGVVNVNFTKLGIDDDIGSDQICLEFTLSVHVTDGDTRPCNAIN